MKKHKMRKYATGGGLPGMDMIAPALMNLIPQAINIGQSANYKPVYDPTADTGFNAGQVASAAMGSGGLGPLGIIAGGLNTVGQLVKMNKNKHTNVYGSPGQYASGGDMSLNNQAFRVNALANQTDAKHYPQFNANLDNNEVVDASRKIVYSDDIKNPTTGNSFADDAAKLEMGKGKSQKKVQRYKDPFAANTIEALDRMGKDLYSKQEVLATVMGKRNNQGQTVQNAAYGGPLDPLITRESTYVAPLPLQGFTPPALNQTEAELSMVRGKSMEELNMLQQTNRDAAFKMISNKDPRVMPNTRMSSRYREYATGGYYGGPGDQTPYMHKSGMKDLYYDPYTNATFTRRKDGKYFPYNGDFQGNSFFSKDEIQQHVKAYPKPNIQLTSNEWQNIGEPGIYNNPDSRVPTYPSLTTSSGYPNMRTSTAPPIAEVPGAFPYPTVTAAAPRPQASRPETRKSNSVKSSPTGPVNSPDPFRFYNQAPDGSNVDDGFRFMDPTGSAPKRFPNFDPLPNTRTSLEAYNPDTLERNVNSLANRTVTSERALPTAAQLYPLAPTTETTPQVASAGRGMFTTGDYLQMASAAASFAPLLQGPQRETPYLDNTQITKQAYDVNPQLYQSGRSYRNAVNSIDTQSPNMRRAIQNGLYAQKLNQDNQIVQQYQGMNNQAQSQYEANVSNQRRYNIGQTSYTNDLNRRNEGAYNTSLDNAFRTVSNFGAGLNQKQQGQDVMNLFRTQYSDVYDRIIKALTSK